MGLDNQYHSMGGADFHIAMTDMLLAGFPVTGDRTKVFPGLRPDQVSIGLPASTRAGSAAEAQRQEQWPAQEPTGHHVQRPVVALSDQPEGDAEDQGGTGGEECEAGAGRTEPGQEEQGRGAVRDGGGGGVPGGVVVAPRRHDRGAVAAGPLLQGHDDHAAPGP